MVFLEISQNSQENTCVRASCLIKLQARPATLPKKRLWRRCFPANFVKYLRTPFLQNTSGRLLLHINTSNHTFLVFLIVSTNVVNVIVKPVFMDYICNFHGFMDYIKSNHRSSRSQMFQYRCY